MSKSGLLIVGTIAFDTVETPYGKVERALGGSATFASIAAGYFIPSRLVGVIGEDFPEEYLDMLRGRGIDTRGVKRAPGKTFFWHGRYETDVNIRETLVTELNVLEGFRPELPEDYLDSRTVFLANIDPVLQLEVLDSLPDASFTVADTMNLWIDIKPAELEKVLARVDVIIVNDSEARQLAGGTANVVRAGRDLLKRGPGAVIIKKGEHGALMMSADGIFSLPAFPMDNVKDPTGAGDSFAGGFIGCIAAGGSTGDAALRRALVAGTATASLCCEDFSVNGMVAADGEALRERIRQIAAATAVDIAPLLA